MFDPATIIAGINVLSTFVQQGVKIYEDSKVTMSVTDRDALHQALLKAEVTTKDLRSKVDAAFAAAERR